MPDWNMQATIMILVGYQMSVFGTVISGGNGDGSVEALIVIAFLLFTPAAVLVAMIKLGDLVNNLIVAILVAVMLFVSGKSYYS